MVSLTRHSGFHRQHSYLKSMVPKMVRAISNHAINIYLILLPTSKRFLNGNIRATWPIDLLHQPTQIDHTATACTQIHNIASTD